MKALLSSILALGALVLGQMACSPPGGRFTSGQKIYQTESAISVSVTKGGTAEVYATWVLTTEEKTINGVLTQSTSGMTAPKLIPVVVRTGESTKPSPGTIVTAQTQVFIQIPEHLDTQGFTVGDAQLILTAFGNDPYPLDITIHW